MSREVAETSSRERVKRPRITHYAIYLNLGILHSFQGTSNCSSSSVIYYLDPEEWGTHLMLPTSAIWELRDGTRTFGRLYSLFFQNAGNAAVGEGAHIPVWCSSPKKSSGNKPHSPKVGISGGGLCTRSLRSGVPSTGWRVPSGGWAGPVEKTSSSSHGLIPPAGRPLTR